LPSARELAQRCPALPNLRGVRRGIAAERHALRHRLEWEVLELEALPSVCRSIMEIPSLGVNVPFVARWNLKIQILWVKSHLVHMAIHPGFIAGFFRPMSISDIIGCLIVRGIPITWLT